MFTLNYNILYGNIYFRYKIMQRPLMFYEKTRHYMYIWLPHEVLLHFDWLDHVFTIICCLLRDVAFAWVEHSVPIPDMHLCCIVLHSVLRNCVQHLCFL